jgi:rhodanese-related sulfurtransferase
VGVLISVVLGDILSVDANRVLQYLQGLINDEQATTWPQYPMALIEGTPQTLGIVVVHYLAAVDIIKAICRNGNVSHRAQDSLKESGTIVDKILGGMKSLQLSSRYVKGNSL